MPTAALLQKKDADALCGSAGAIDAPGERGHLMAEFDIAYTGRHYEYDGYRYDYLTDAVNYARLQRSRRLGDTPVESRPSRGVVDGPSESERQLMADLVITYEDGVYHFGPYRYDRLADAVNYAYLQARP